jgi:hypothetical protein
LPEGEDRVGVSKRDGVGEEEKKGENAQVDVETPAPRHMVRKRSTQKRSDDGRDGEDRSEQAYSGEG